MCWPGWALTGPARRPSVGPAWADALANFDSATITTTHGFCHMMLNALGVWGDVAPGAVLLEDPEDLVEEVVDDLLGPPRARSAALSRCRAVTRCGPASKWSATPGYPWDRPRTGGT